MNWEKILYDFYYFKFVKVCFIAPNVVCLNKCSICACKECIICYCLTKRSISAKSLQSCPTLCDPIDSSPPGSPIPGILQARTLEWVAISFSNTWKWKVKVKLLSRVQFLATPWTAAHQAPPSMGFSRQEYWSGVPLPSLEKVYRCQLYPVDWWAIEFNYVPTYFSTYWIYFW